MGRVIGNRYNLNNLLILLNGERLLLETTPGETLILWPIIVYFGAVLLIVLGMLATVVLGQRHEGRETGEPYESGIVSTGSARVRLSAKFYLVAMLFVIFDLEAAFLIAWAIAFKEVGWVGYLGVLVFVGVLVAALIYEWRMGALDWGSTKSKRRTSKDVNRREAER